MSRPSARLGYLAALAIVASSSTAWAQSGPGTEGTGIGAGVESTLTGVSGPTLAYQAPQFHVEGILGFHDDGETQLALAGRFFWELHSTAASDLSIGGGLSLVNTDPGPGDSNTDIHFEVGAQIRAFVAANVALGATIGLGLINTDGDDPAFLTGQLVGSIGLTYFFF